MFKNKNKSRRLKFNSFDNRKKFYPREMVDWKRWLVAIFAIIGAFYVLGKSINVFADAGRFLFVDSRKVVIANNFVKTDVAEEVKAFSVAQSNIADKEMVDPKVEEESQSPSTPSTDQVKEEIGKVFGKDSRVAVAVFKNESGFNPKAKNYNCRYDGKSQSCRSGDEDKAWSVDCGVAQINTLSKECPEELYDYKNNIKIAKSMFDRRGFQPWVVYNNGYHLADL